MKMTKLHVLLTLALSVSLVAVGCDKKEDAPTDENAQAEEAAADAAPEIKVDKGVDLETKTIHVGALNDTSGPAVAIGKPFMVGKKLVSERANAGELLPEGWKIEMHNKDHGYNPQKALQAFKEISDDILYVATSFGTPPTLQVRPMLERDEVVAFPASLSTQLAENEFTPPIGPTYKIEAMRAFDWAIEHAKKEGTEFKPGIIYQGDDYGKDGIEGFKQSAEAHGVEIVAETSLKPGEKEVTAAVKKLQDAGANYVMLTLLPSSAAPVLGTAAQLKYQPVFVGNTPAWVDAFFAEDSPAPKQIFANFYWATGFPYWGEDVPGMEEFEATHAKYAKDQPRDFYVLVSYIQGLAQAEILKRAIENKDLTREGFRTAMHSIEDWDAGGLIQPVSLAKVPYVTGTKTRVLKPNFEEKSWDVAGDYKTPKAFKANAEKQVQKQEE
jgi:ABC-type branched-subunit amino acid transport system substrate-binding protein